MPDLRAWGRARTIGAADAAERLGGTVMGTEHLLLAALSDPVVRWAFRTAGVGVDAVEARAALVTGKRPLRGRRDGIVPAAAEAIMAASAGSDRLDDDDPGAPELARVRQALVQGFLTRRTRCDARAVLDGLGLLEHRAQVLAVLEQNAGPPARPPRRPAALTTPQASPDRPRPGA